MSNTACIFKMSRKDGSIDHSKAGHSTPFCVNVCVRSRKGSVSVLSPSGSNNGTSRGTKTQHLYVVSPTNLQLLFHDDRHCLTVFESLQSLDWVTQHPQRARVEEFAPESEFSPHSTIYNNTWLLDVREG